MSLGPVQLAILAFIRKHSMTEGTVETEVIKQWAKNTLGVRSNDQVSITVHRLESNGYVQDKRCGMVQYLNSPKNEAEFERQLFIAKLTVELGD